MSTSFLLGDERNELQAVFKGWSSFKENLGRRRSFHAPPGSDYSATDDELGVERSGHSTPASRTLRLLIHPALSTLTALAVLLVLSLYSLKWHGVMSRIMYQVAHVIP
jgi:hypothetical protein